MNDQDVVAHRAVDVRELGQSVDHGAGHERQVGQAEPLRLLEAILLHRPDRLNA